MLKTLFIVIASVQQNLVSFKFNKIAKKNERSRENRILVGFNELQPSSELGLSSQLSHVEE